MLKKLLIFALSLSFIIWYSFADNNITSKLQNAGSGYTILLDNWESFITKKTSFPSYMFVFRTGDNSFLAQDISNINSQISIKCKNWYLVNIGNNGTYTYTWDWQQSEVTVFNPSKTLTLTCKPIGQPVKKLKNTNINYQTTEQKNWDWGPSFPATLRKPNITSDDIVKFKSKQDIDNQPSFTDVVYLQLEVIWNLSDSLINTKSAFDFSQLFKITSHTWYNFTWYNMWLDKFWNYTNKKDFIDAMSGAITLKDIWVAQDVIKWLYDCVNNNHCNWSINFQHNILDKYQTYSLDNIQKTLYLKTDDNVLDDAIKYYNYLSTTCNNLSSIQDDFLKKQTQNICNEIVKQNVDTTNQKDLDNYNLGYGLWQRVKNLKIMKDHFKTLWTWVNILGIYNTYYELTKLNLWVNKLSNVKKVENEVNSDKQYESIRKIFVKEKKYVADKKIIKDNSLKKKVKIKAMNDVFTPWSVMNKAVQTISNFNPNIDITVVTTNWKSMVSVNWWNFDLNIKE